MERYTDPRVVIEDLLADGIPANSEDLISSLLDDELNEITVQAIEIARNEY